MNQVNFEYLKEQLRNTGFGENLGEALSEKIKENQPEFQLAMTRKFGTSDDVNATLYFKRGADSDMYFFNRYNLQLLNKDGDEKAKQMFYINKGSSVTLKEGYNLLEGRAVHKTLTSRDNEKYGAWLQLDFKNVSPSGNYEFKKLHDNYGYKLETTLAKYPIKELSDEKSKQDLMKSLEKGNLQSVTIKDGDKEERIFIAANPEYKTLTAFNTGGQRIKLIDFSQKQEEKKEATVKTEQSQKQTAQKEAPKQNEKPAAKRTKKVKV